MTDSEDLGPIEELADFAVTVHDADRYRIDRSGRGPATAVLYFGTFEVEATRYELAYSIGSKARQDGDDVEEGERP